MSCSCFYALPLIIIVISDDTTYMVVFVIFSRNLQENTYFPEYSGMYLIHSIERSAPGSRKIYFCKIKLSLWQTQFVIGVASKKIKTENQKSKT